MKNTIAKLQRVISDYQAMLKAISAEEFAYKPSPDKWSKKEILGHLIDSAQNNIRRFIVAQYEAVPFIIYNQDKWVAISNYQHASSAELTELWVLLNNQICRILDNTTSEAAMQICETNDHSAHTIAWLAEDYIKHLLHHLHQILQLEPVEYP